MKLPRLGLPKLQNLISRPDPKDLQSVKVESCHPSVLLHRKATTHFYRPIQLYLGGAASFFAFGAENPLALAVGSAFYAGAILTQMRYKYSAQWFEDHKRGKFVAPKTRREALRQYLQKAPIQSTAIVAAIAYNLPDVYVAPAYGGGFGQPETIPEQMQSAYFGAKMAWAGIGGAVYGFVANMVNYSNSVNYLESLEESKFSDSLLASERTLAYQIDQEAQKAKQPEVYGYKYHQQGPAPAPNTLPEDTATPIADRSNDRKRLSQLNRRP